MKKFFNINLFIFIGLILGILGGIFLPDIILKISFIGDIYINLLKLIILPVIFTSVTLSIYKSLKNRKLGISKLILAFILVFVFVFIFTSVVFYFAKLGKGFNISEDNYETEIADLSIKSFLENVFPSNIVDVFKNNNILFVIIFACVFSFASFKSEKGNKVIDIIESFNDVLNKIISYLVYLIPIVIIPLIGKIVANNGSLILGATLKYILIVYLISIIVMLIATLITLLKVKSGTYIKKVLRTALMSIATCSSIATYPVTLKGLREEEGLDVEKVDLFLSLGIAINKIGGAISFAALAIFTSQIYGVEISILQYLLMLVLALVFNFSAAGIPSGGIVLGTTYTAALGLPLGFIGIYAGIYRLLDMAYTTVNTNLNANITAYFASKKDKAKVK